MTKHFWTAQIFISLYYNVYSSDCLYVIIWTLYNIFQIRTQNSNHLKNQMNKQTNSEFVLQLRIQIRLINVIYFYAIFGTTHPLTLLFSSIVYNLFTCDFAETTSTYQKYKELKSHFQHKYHELRKSKSLPVIYTSTFIIILTQISFQCFGTKAI